jgi:hypothetical protein
MWFRGNLPLQKIDGELDVNKDIDN